MGEGIRPPRGSLPPAECMAEHSRSGRGVVVAAQLIGGALSNIPAGAGVSRFGSRAMMSLGMLVCSLGGLLALLATGFASLFLALLVSGIGYSCFNVGVSALMRDVCPPQFRGRVVSIKGGLGRMAMMVGTAIGGLVADSSGLPATVALRALLPLAGLVVYLTLPCCLDRRATADSGGTRSPGAIAAAKTSIYEEPALSTCGVVRLTRRKLCTAGYIAFSIMMVRNARRILIPLAGESVGLGVAEIGGAMSLMSLADSLCFPLVGVLSDRHGRKFTGVPACKCSRSHRVFLRSLKQRLHRRNAVGRVPAARQARQLVRRRRAHARSACHRHRQWHELRHHLDDG